MTTTTLRNSLGLALYLLVVLGFMGCNSSDIPTDSGIAEWLGETVDSSQFAPVDGSHELTFPTDHGSHDDFMTEWWYITSVLKTDAGREFGVQFTIFRRALAPDSRSENLWDSGQVYMAHVALSDVARRKHYDEERISREHPELAGVSTNPFRAFVENWSVSSISGDFSPLSLRFQADSFAVDLRMSQTKSIVLQGENGYSVKSPEHASYYYSIPRMSTEGSLTIGKRSYEVVGLSWMDREWSSGLLGRQYEGWYWFALSFEDGRDLIFFSLRDRETGMDSNRMASWIEVDSTTTPIARDSWSVKPTRYWKQWPVEWELSVKDSRFVVSAKFENQEMNTRISYWEGIVDIRKGTSVIGSGYMELTGYQ
ncbi:MAG: carotenoid 1,2-hydratase [Gammaproteobacteria bacterium]|nr:carotenoid 1,2-hydratase [Gammaproteobacteria bacterium]MYD80668.1 carotenoid 1,2-hydratase [Gammaproteobacteria bacterium]